MAIQRMKIDTKGKNILQVFFDNINEIGAINKLVADDDPGTYDGNGGDVNITWPKAGKYANAWQEPLEYQEYFVREIDAPTPEPMAPYPGAPMVGELRAPFSKEQNDEHPSPIKIKDDSFAGKSPKLLEWNDNVYRDAGAVGHGRGTQGSFMATKGRKSLYTLLQETWGVFFDDKRGPVFHRLGTQPREHITNRYSSDENKSYAEQFGDTIGGDVYYPPTSADINNSVTKAFNLGQIIGPDQSIIDDLIEKGVKLTKQFFHNLVNDALLEENPFLAAWWHTMSGVVTGPADRVSQLYRPGFSRPPIPGERGRKSQIPLREMLEQNLLLPPASGSLPIPYSQNDDDERVESTFNELYVRNRAAGGTIDPRYSNGLIAGTGINDLQEPIRDLAGNADVKSNGTVRVPFTFEEDDAQYLTHSQKVAGFISNTPNTMSNPDAMSPAVIDAHRSEVTEGENREATYIANAREVIDHSNGQYFPFTFSTVNKKNMRMQICSLQATIQSLGESYTPTWQSKHFFGRSEQIHTYTFTDRTIDLSFAIFADSMRQLQNVYERVLWLAQQCYPDYNNKDRMATGPLIAMRIGDLLQHKAGFIRSLSYDWNYLGAGGKWELTRGVRMPQACNVSMSYQVIHERVPDRDFNFYGGPMGGVGAGMQIQRESEYTQNNTFDESIRENDNGRYIPPGVLYDGSGPDGANIGEREYLKYVEARNEPEFDSEMLDQMRANARDPKTGRSSFRDDDAT